ncbi:MAG: PEP-CTERM sorting domain-containing protein, partial [Pseudomonadota bacterium]
MTPEEVHAALRDIHTPIAEAGSVSQFAPEPLILFALVAAGVWLWSAMRRRRWRRQARARMAEITALSDPRAEWDALIALLSQVARHARQAPPPDFLFEPDETIADDRLTALRDEIGR